MSQPNDFVASIVQKGLVRRELRTGVVSFVGAQFLLINLGSDATKCSGTFHAGARYGKGEVGEFVIVESQQTLAFGRIVEVRLPERDRQRVDRSAPSESSLSVVAKVQLLGTIPLDKITINSGISVYPRIGDSVYSAPAEFVAAVPMLHGNSDGDEAGNQLIHIGATGAYSEGPVSVKPEAIFGRHCAVLGATGGGKSWTTARLIEETLKLSSKVILLDATGEYRGFEGEAISHYHFASPVSIATDSQSCCLPPGNFEESDFLSLFNPSGKVQGPKLREAMKSLRLAYGSPELAEDGLIRKINQPKAGYLAALSDPTIAAVVDDPKSPFDFRKLSRQIEEECVYPEGFGAVRGQKDPSKWGGESGEFAHCISLVTRIEGVIHSQAFSCVFQDHQNPVEDQINHFIQSPNKRLMRICLSGIGHEYNAREIVANALGRTLLAKARELQFSSKPVLVILDEAHHFIGRSIGVEDEGQRLNAFELIAKEGRKYGLNICLATQRPRDITEGVLSQMGALIVHRLTNDRDRQLIERACGEIDKSAMEFIPVLQPGEAILVGVDFPIPMTVQIRAPSIRPKSDGPNYQEHWPVA